ncbi:MAG: type II toxin-antitoxin system death-on-curing family toxin, partial [Alphaproteobacteria bacterium]
MSAFRLPPIEAFLDAHREYIDRFGGDPGVRDLGRLEAALGRAQSLIDYGGGPTIFEIAAIVSHGVSNNHAFIDGNKRVSFGAIVAILHMNGYDLDVTERDAVAVTFAVAKSEMDHAALSRWIR